MRTLPILVPAALTLLGLSSRAQSSDDCATPTAIVGVGPHAFDNTGAVLDVQVPICGTAGRDVWFHWVAPATSPYVVQTCGGTTADTMLAVYAGVGCPAGSQLTCNDNGCGTQSSATFYATAGADYTIQIATYYQSPGAGTFTFLQAPGCALSAGADVIVGDMGGISNYTASGGIDSFSLGTMLCNVGDAPLDYVGNTNRHPVFGSNLYRYRVQSGAGRFEQIGLSWLTHGYFTENETFCCPSCSVVDSQHLGVGCADKRFAGDNGLQSSLGPRWQVNASTGDFPFPPANPPWSGTARRLQYATSDVDISPGVRYFVEVQVVTPDDAAAGNGANSASYREVWSATGINFEAMAVTHREQTAVEAWQACESGVGVADVDVPADGRFRVACKVTDLGGGQWHYEYAVQNLNSHRSGGAFSIPVGAATIANIGFHDVVYRNGDGEGGANYSGADWTAVNAAGVLTWSTQTQAQNANANALRWGTTYNFRFDANVAPVAGLASLGLWRGAPSAVDAAVEVPGPVGTIAAYCFGDGTGTPCPCGNAGAAGNGCASSVNASGANLAATGSPSIVADTLVLQGAGMSNSSALYFQGTTPTAAVFGDGLRCAGGSVVRLGTKTNVAGASAFPVAGDPSVSVRGGCAAGDVRVYQCWYRNAAAFCTASTFNLTNGLSVTWVL